MRTGPPLRRLVALVCLGLAIVASIIASRSIFRVPEGEIGACGRTIYPPGWHLKAPFRQARVVPLSGSLEALEVRRRTEEGAEISVRLSLHYRLTPGPLSLHADEIAEDGLNRLAARLAKAALDPLPTSILLTATPQDGGRGPAPVPRTAIEAIAAKFRAEGIEPTSLTAQVGLPQAAGREDLGSAPAAAGGSMPAPETRGIRLLMMGLDGADWDIIDPLLRQGRLPNLARLVASGVRAPLRSYDPMISPLLWTTMVTGVGPDVHGVADFLAIDESTGRRVPISSRFRKVKALWNILTDAGESSAFVAWWASYPAEKVEGVQVSNLAAFETVRPRPQGAAFSTGITYPPDYFDQIRPGLHTAADLSYDEVLTILRIDRSEFEAARREVLKPATQDEKSANRQAVQKPVSLALSILTGSKNYAAIATDLAARKFGLTAVYFEGIDMMGHRFQHCMPPRMALCPDADFERFRDAVTSFYVRQDDLLGPILKAAGPETTVLVVSDHGFKTGASRPAELLPYTTQQPVEWHDEEGIFILSGPGARRGERLAGRATLFDIAPTILYLLGLPAAETMPGHVLLQALDPDLVSAHPPRTIPSYETLGAPREILASGGPGAEQAEQELLSNLRALGYIGGDVVPGSPPGAAGPGPGAGGSPPGGAGHAATAARGGSGETTQVFYHRNLATYFLKRQEYEKAAEQLRLANERQKLPKNYQMLAEAYAGLGRIDEAVAVLEEGLKSVEAKDPESVLWMVQIRLAGAGAPGAAGGGTSGGASDGGRSAALEIAGRWASITAKKPGLDDAIAGLLKESEGDARGAVALYRRSLGADPTRVVAAQRLFAIQGAEGGAALEPILRRALAKDPRIDEYHNLLGLILASAGRGPEAVASFGRASDLDPDNPRFASNLAAGLARLGRWEEAAAAYEKAAALDPSAGNFLRLGSAYRRLKRPDRALAAFERARAAGDSGSGPLLGIALARRDLKQIPEALAAVREGLDRHPDDPALRSLYEELLRTTGTPAPAPGPPGSGR